MKKFSPLLGKDSESLQQMVEVITRQTDDIRRIVDEFSKFARMPELKRKNEDLCALITSVISLQRAGQPTVSIKFSKPETPIIISIDATLINQAITNILKNAGEAIETRKLRGLFAEEDGIIKVSLKDKPESVVLEISDNGIGLPQDRSRLFEPYVTTREKGTGLGLAIVKKIVEEHGGVLKLENAKPFINSSIIGASISIDLPKSKKIDQNGRSNNIMSDILIVDDEKDIRELISEILIDEGYSTKLAANSTDCLDIIFENPPSLLILIFGSKIATWTV